MAVVSLGQIVVGFKESCNAYWARVGWGPGKTLGWGSTPKEAREDLQRMLTFRDVVDKKATLW